MIAVREAWKAGLLGREHWLRNIVSGVIVGVVALSLAMAFAITSGVKPEQGIYTGDNDGRCHFITARYHQAWRTHQVHP
jgi:MFS superfamily sulfate permease-like transporter